MPVFSLNKGRVLLADKVGNLTLINLANGEHLTSHTGAMCNRSSYTETTCL